MTSSLQDNMPLLKKMMADMKSQKDIYKPGPFWLKSATETERALKRYGLENFRSTKKATPGCLFTDAPRQGLYDNAYGSPKGVIGKFKLLIGRLTYENDVLRRMFLDHIDEKIRANAEQYFKEYLFYRDYYWENSSCYDWLSEVLRNHNLPDTMVGGCINAMRVCGHTIGCSYFYTLVRIFNFYDHIDLKKMSTMLIIGGGFGYEAHLLMSLFPNIKKCITLDIPPNLYVQTQYLKAVMKERVMDYIETSDMTKIKFSQTQEREIIAIAPWQIENVDASIDLLWNSCSFQEMTLRQVQNYALFSQNLMAKSTQPKICLTMYNREAKMGTLRAEVLTAFENFCFEKILAKRKLPELEPHEELYYTGSTIGHPA